MACITASVIGAVGSLGGAAIAASGSGGGGAAPSYGETTAQTLKDQISLAPQMYAAEANPNYGQPAYSTLELQNLNTLLTGSPGTASGSVSKTADQTGWYDASGNYLSPGTLNPNYGLTPDSSGYVDSRANGVLGLFGQGNPALGGNTASQQQYLMGAKPQAGAVWRTSGSNWNVTTPGSAAVPGIFSQLQAQNTGQRTADINDVMNLGPLATQAMLAADPYNAALLGKLNAQANQGLDAGSSLTPDQQRAMQQQSRAAFAARGMGGGNQGVTDELLKQFNLGQQLLTQRQQFAQSLVGTNQGVLGDPFQQILSRSSGAIPMAQQSQSQSGPQLFNPQAGLGLATSNYATQMQAAAANNPLSQMSGMMSGIGNLAKGLGSAFSNG